MGSDPITVCVDIGGTKTKAVRCDRAARPLGAPLVADTPAGAAPEVLVETIAALAADLGGAHRASVGFPGIVRCGVTYGAVNLHGDWQEFPLERRLAEALAKPVRVANDADIHGLGAVTGNGTELVLTLGTGIGSALFTGGRLVPNLELGHLPYRGGRSFEDELGSPALERIGAAAWRARLPPAIATLARALNHDRLYLGGGNARHLAGCPAGFLPDNVVCIRNDAGLTGGVCLWEGIPRGREIPRLA